MVHLLKSKTKPMQARKQRKVYELFQPSAPVPIVIEEHKDESVVSSGDQIMWTDATALLKRSKRNKGSVDRDNL